MRYLLVALAAVAGMLVAPMRADAARVESPKGQLVVRVELVKGAPQYAIDWRGEPLVELSSIELAPENTESNGWRVVGEERSAVDETWSPVVGKRRICRGAYNELVVRLVQGDPDGVRLDVIVRAYDDGVALRSRLPDGADAAAERFAFRFAGEPRFWSHSGERRPAGPVALAEADGKLRSPVLLQFESGGYAALHEADLRQSGWMAIKATPGKLTAAGSQKNLAPGWQTPWRVVQVGEGLSELVDSDLIANLNPKADPEAFAWVKPGVALWDWRSWGYVDPSGFEYGLGLESWKRFIDFASEQGVPYVLLDANWYGPEHDKRSNPFTGGVAEDVRRAIDYGKQRGVGLVLYLNDVAGTEYGIEEILRTWSEWGAAGIKYGFMKNRPPAKKVAWTRKIVELCAKNRLLVNFHDGPVPPAGGEATLPNWVTREFCHAQSDARRSFTPSTFLMQMAVNQLAGPIDMNNGLFDLNQSVAKRPKIFKQVDSTITAEAARTLIVYSGMTVIPDAPPIYRRHPELFRFIAAQKMPWTESKTLAFEMGEHITVMRQTGDTYLVASATSEQGRTLAIPLDFLPGDKQYSALVCEDAAEAHFRDNREAYTTRTMAVNASTTIEARLAPGGGHCLLITPRN